MSEGKEKKFGAKLGSSTSIRVELEKASEKLAEEEVEALGGFRPAGEVLGETEDDEDDSGSGEVDPVAKTIATPLPPSPLPEREPEPEPVQTETGSFEVKVEDDSTKTDDAAKVARQALETLEAPAVTPVDLARAGVVPPFTSERITDSGPIAPPSEEATPTPAPLAPPIAPRPNHHRVAMPPATPARLFWVNYRARIVLAIAVAVIGLMTLGGVAGYTFAIRSVARVASGDSIAVGEGLGDTAPQVAPVEEARPARPVMPPSVIEPPPGTRPTTATEPDEPSRRPICRRIGGAPGRLLYRCE
ncbi:MAG: hypothetical protein NUW08_00725 [Candidatus Uhrbacteria bacterium]|nr:hypothetical protein [Candidatus Uhrbacteria bacterium]